MQKKLERRMEDAEALHTLQQEIDERDITLKYMRAERLGIPFQNVNKQVKVQDVEEEQQQPGFQLPTDESIEQ